MHAGRPLHIVLVRHGQTEANATGIVQGHLPTSLNELGHRQARLVARRLATFEPRIDLIISSDLPRTRETATPLAAALSMGVHYDPAWRERILSWYSRPSNTALPRAGLQTPNAYGVQDLHGLVWEWTEDYSALLVDGDNRNQGDADNQRFCGAGALSMDDRDNYAVLMRVAMLSSLGGADATANLGFRCARSAP